MDRANEESAKQAHTLSSNMSEPEEMPEPMGGNSLDEIDESAQPKRKVLQHPS